MSRLAYIYKITNPKGKIYIGSTFDIDARKCRYKNGKCESQTKLYRSFIKYGYNNHIFEVIAQCDELDRNRQEAYYGALFCAIGVNGLNLKLPKISDDYVCIDPSVHKKIADKNRGKKRSEEFKANLRLFKSYCSEETRQKLRIANTGKKLTEEHKEKISIAHFGKKLTEEHKKKIGAKSKGNKHRLGIRPSDKAIEASKKANLNKVVSQETKEKLSKSKIGHSFNLGNKRIKRGILLNVETGIFYPKFNDAAKSIGMNPSTFRRYVNGVYKNNTNIKYV